MKQLNLLFIFAIFSIIPSCKNEYDGATENTMFKVKDSKETGITFSNDLAEGAKLNIVEYLYYYNGGGVAVGDINNDGLEDIYFASNQKQDKLYLNKGNLKFEDITTKAGISDVTSWSNGVTMDDINNDGLIDIYVSKVGVFSAGKGGQNVLYINQGNGTFKNLAEQYGVAFKGFSTQSCFLDYDHDGDLDMYLLNHAVHSVRSYGSVEKRGEKDSLSGDLFFENRIKEEGKFVDVTSKVGIFNSPLGYGLGISCSDVNNDGWTDIYVGNDFHENDYLYINNGNKTFTESTSANISHTSQFSMGVDIADMNNDGWQDIFTTDMMPSDEDVTLVSGGEDSDNIKRIKDDFGFAAQNARNHFQLNNQDGSFSDIGYITKTFATDWSWSVLLQDFDNNQKNDIFISNGIVKRPNNLDYINFLNEYDSKGGETNPQRTKELINKMPSQPLQNILFYQTDNLKFSPIQKSFVGPKSFSTGAAYSDLDNDGDLDIITNNINQVAFLYENTTSPKANYLSVILKTDGTNATTKGSRVMLYAQGKELTKELQTTKGFMSSSTHKLHFGLDQIKTIDSLVIVWPDQMAQVEKNVIVNKTVTYIRSKTNLKKAILPSKVNQSGLNMLVLPIKHEDNKFFDDNNEKLIPERLSYEGPALINEDLTGDGVVDLYIGGGRNQPAKLMIGSKNGSFSEKKTAAFDTDAKYEDVDAATIDFDGDGDRDLYVVSGGGDVKELDKLLEDRLYLNNGNGVFKRIPISLPHTNGSCIAVSDVDGDGFEDMFVGARSIPGSYGLSPYSFLLKNKNGQGLDILQKERYGMVRDAKFIDIDNDKDKDLVMCGDWMPIMVYENNGGKFTYKSKALGLDADLGFWNTIAFADVNKDGKLDILAGNAGLNQKWNASATEPIKMYVGDFDKNGSSEPLIFYKYFNRYVPLAPMSLLTSQLPILKKQFTDYAKYVKVKDIADLFTNYKENLVETKTVTELRSKVYINEGGKYVGYALNNEEQYSDIQSFEVTDKGDIYYVGNNAEYSSELGKNTSNSGRKLGKFDTVKKQFSTSIKLPLPQGISAKKISSFGPDKHIVVANNSYVFVLTNNH